MNKAIIHTMEQGTDEWHAVRCGKLTASMVRAIITPAKLGYAKNDKARAHVYEIAAQRATNYVEPTPTTWAMERGHIDEVYARELYNDTKCVPAHEVGFITRDVGGAVIGYSPDGIVGEDGLIEIKSRAQKHQMKTIAVGVVPAEYMLQIQTGLLVTGREWCDFVSYSGGMPLFVVRVLPMVEYAEAITAAAIAFEETVNETLAQYHQNSAGMPVAERHDNEDEISL